MISLKDIYHVVEATVPLYAAMFLAYISIKWWKLFSPDQCSGINKFVAKIALPLLSFQVISANNPYQMNPKLIFSDVGQKLLSLFVFSILSKVCFRGNFEWIITGFSVSTMPNTLVVGIPLLKAMYGDEAAQLLGQIIVLQSLVWNTFLLFLFELRAAKMIDLTPSEDTGKNISVALDAEAESESVEETGFKLEHRKVQDPAPTKIRTQIIMLIVGRKLLRNPNTFSCLAGLIWGLISFRWGLKLPVIVNNSISILSDGGLGMAMFSLGLFMASQPNIIACGIRMLVLSLGIRFIIGPSFMAIPSYSIGMRGTLFSVAIMQAALPQGIVPFIYAKEYGVHADILSTGVIVGMIIVIPIALAYYFLLHPT